MYVCMNNSVCDMLYKILTCAYLYVSFKYTRLHSIILSYNAMLY